MSAVLRDVLGIWRVTTVQRDPRGYRILAGLALLLALGTVLFAALMVWKHKIDAVLLLQMAAGAGGFWLTLAGSMLFVRGSMMLNSPVNGRLLPRQRRRLQQMAAGVWLLQTAAFTLAAGDWLLFPLVGMFSLGMMLAMAGNLAGLPLMVVPGSWSAAWRASLPPALAGNMTGAAAMTVLAALVLFGVAWCVRWMYPAGGDEHLGKRSARLEAMRRYETQMWAPEVDSANMGGRHALRIYAAVLRRDCRGAAPGRMLMHALGPGGHWSVSVSWLAGFVALGLGLHLAMALYDNDRFHRFVQAMAGPGVMGMTSMILFSTAQIGQAMQRTRGEQALLRLTPLLGDLASMNRHLAAQLLRQTLATWVVMTAALLLLGGLLGGPGVLARQAALCCLAGQVAMTGLLVDYAGAGGWSVPLALRAGLLALLQCAAALGVGALAASSPWPWLAAIAILATGLQLRRAWRRMLAAPPAFPVRRLALS